MRVRDLLLELEPLSEFVTYIATFGRLGLVSFVAVTSYCCRRRLGNPGASAMYDALVSMLFLCSAHASACVSPVGVLRLVR